MKKNRLKTLGLFFLCVPLFASCGFIKSKDTAMGIQDITYEVAETGDIIVTISYTDKKKEPLTFTIPKGEIGEDGNGIKEFVPVVDPVSGETTITVYFTDESMPAKTFTVPQSKGIKEVYTELDTAGNTVVWFEYTNNTFSKKFTIAKGDTGLGFADYQAIVNDDQSVDLIFVFNDDPNHTLEIHIPAPEKGDTGNGIDHIATETTETKYLITVYYTDGTSQTVDFEKPIVNQWYSIHGAPAASLGIDGDYAFDLDNDRIYLKKDGIWTIVVQFSTNTTLWEVKFNLNASDAVRVSGDSIYHVTNGQTFYSTKKGLPLAYRPGYSFGGWSTNSTTPNATNGLFTDLTPVLCDTDLYAVWVPNETVWEVKFDLNASDAVRESGDSIYYITNGQTFYSTNNDLPLASRPGYSFGGWSTKATTPNATNGLFTDLTPVLSNMELYAVWVD